MNRFERLPISRRLTIISVVTITLALIVSSAVFLVYDRLSMQQQISRRVQSQADTIAFNSATALVFNDPTSAATTLSGLRSDPHVMSARIHTGDGRLFAQYARPDIGSSVPPRPLETAANVEIVEDELVVRRPISFEGKALGTLIVRSDLLERDERFRTYAVIVVAVSLLAFGVALTFGRLAQRSVSQPILELAEAAQRIAVQNDLSVRPMARSGDEVGTLVAAFSQMLDGLQRRDQELQTTHRELEKRIEEADEANRLKDEFLATLSHELRTPLNAILGWAHILRRGGLDAEATDRALETISRNALAQGQIIADILDMQRITTGKLRLNLEPVDLAPVIRRSMDTVNPAARVKEIEIRQAVDEEAGLVLGDEGRLQQVLWNLLTNAVKFTPKGGVVRVALRAVDSNVELTVEDTGPGLVPAFIPYAFDRFRQADSSSTRSHGGLGLGLAIVRNLVELHGGSVVAANREGGTGAVFMVKLPRLGMRPQRHARAVEDRYPGVEHQVSLNSAPSLHGIRVLVVDDELDSREITAATLARCGADVVSASSAEEGFEALKRDRPQVLLSDIEMPGADGYSLIRKVRDLAPEEGGSTPAAAFTAYAGTEHRMKALTAGFQMHVPKPVQPAELAAIVASLARGPVR